MWIKQILSTVLLLPSRFRLNPVLWILFVWLSWPHICWWQQWWPVCWVVLFCDCSCRVGCAEHGWGEEASRQHRQLTRTDVCLWQTSFRTLLPGSGPWHIPLSLHPETEGLVFLATFTVAFKIFYFKRTSNLVCSWHTDLFWEMFSIPSFCLQCPTKQGLSF